MRYPTSRSVTIRQVHTCVPFYSIKVNERSFLFYPFFELCQEEKAYVRVRSDRSQMVEFNYASPHQS